VECAADAAVCRARLAERARSRGVSDGRAEIFDAFTASFEAVTELAPDEHLVVDTTRAVDDSIAAFLTRVAAWPRGLVG
jgi:hypothetical protein